MAKEFLDFNTMFSVQEIERERINWLSRLEDADTQITRWDREVASYSNETIRHAVYFANDSISWQRLRVSLKGLTTQQKLAILKLYAEDFLNVGVVQCRVDNYIGALVRGGQLSTGTYDIIR